MSGLPHHIFISYARPDQSIAEELAELLRREGASPWLDVERVRSGESFSELLQRAMDESDAFVLLIGDHSSSWVRYEWSEVLKRTWRHPEHPVVPVLTDRRAAPGYLRDEAAIRVDRRTGEGLDAVVARLKRAAERPTTRSPAGEERLSRRLAEIEQTASRLADALEEGRE